jgi:peptidoglycan/LPS O-acetylase OafA/YrhL
MAVLFVIYHHWIDGSTRVPWGAIGVKLFFVLSGFLITRILLKSRFTADGSLADRLKTFFVRRTLRIFPLYYAVLALAALSSPWFRELWPWYVTYLQNVAMMRAGQFLFAAHFWTLAIEEQFYLVWPLLVFVLPVGTIGPTLTALVVVAPLWRAVGHFALHLNDVQITVSTLGSLDALALGGLLAWSIMRGRFLSNRALTVSALVGIGLIVTHVLLQNWTLDVTLSDSGIALICFSVVAYFVRPVPGRWRAFLGAAPIVYVGRISYGIYVYHFFVPAKLSFLDRWLVRSAGPIVGSWLFAVSCLLVTIVLAALSWTFFERPINDLKDRIAPTQGTPSIGPLMPTS